MSGLKLLFTAGGRFVEMSVNGKPLLFRGYPLFPGDKERLEEIVRRDNAHAPLVEALENCAEVLDTARDMLGICGEGDGKDRKADRDDVFGIRNSLAGANAALALTKGVPK